MRRMVKTLFVWFVFVSGCCSCVQKAKDMELVLHLPMDYSFEISLETADTILNLVVDSTKTAVARLPLANSCYGRLWVGDRHFPLWLEASTSLDVTLEMNVLYFKENSEKINAYLNRKWYNSINFRDYGMEDLSFRTKLDNMVQEQEQVLDTSGFDPFFMNLERKRMLYDRRYELASNIVYGGQGDRTLSGDTFMELRESLTEDSTAWGILEYAESVQQAIHVLARMEESSVNSKTLLMNVLKIATENLKDMRLIEFVVARSVLSYVRSHGMEGIEAMERVFQERVKRTDYLAEYNQYIERNKPLLKGQPTVPFTFQDVEGKDVSLSDLKGKYVYIDVWATWCGPCNAEIPHLKVLEKKLHGRNIYFVSISCDESKEAWLKFVKDKKLDGIQLIMGEDRSFMESILCSGIPRFLLIDKEGNYVNANMSRPSDPKTLEVLENLPGL